LFGQVEVVDFTTHLCELVGLAQPLIAGDSFTDVRNDRVPLRATCRTLGQAAIRMHPRERTTGHIPSRARRRSGVGYPYTDADFQAWLEVVATAAKQQGQPVNWAIRDEMEFLIGGCGFENLQIGKSHRAEIGYWLAKPHWGRGIMTAVVRRP
jgi:RimJ/RimL family protein N-acetyltransferase